MKSVREKCPGRKGLGHSLYNWENCRSAENFAVFAYQEAAGGGEVDFAALKVVHREGRINVGGDTVYATQGPDLLEPAPDVGISVQLFASGRDLKDYFLPLGLITVEKS